jgi:hypothetical protein
MEEFDKFELDKMYHNKHPKLLNNYSLLTPDYVIFNLEKGDIIRYSKGIDEKLSCACVIIDIEYNGKTKKVLDDKRKVKIVCDRLNSYIEKITLMSIRYKNSYWDIVPDENFIFKFAKKPKRRGRKKNNIKINENIINDTIDKINKTSGNTNTLTLKKLLNIDPIIKGSNNENKNKKKNISRVYVEKTREDYENKTNINDAVNHIDNLIKNNTNNNKKKKIKIVSVKDATDFIDNF